MRSEVHHDVRIPMADGVELAAEVRLPEGSGPWPTIVSLIPYHKDDLMGAAFEYDSHSCFVAHGYATVMVDLRGLGGSSGVALGAGDPQDGRDGAAIVEWAAAQQWSDGNVGMWGFSYGGITTLKTAVEAPPALKAIVPIMTSSTSVYADWVFPGGCRNMLGATGIWGSFMVAMQLLPPMYLDPEGRSWQRWRERLGAADPYLLAWEAHPDRDEYWSEGAIEPADNAVPSLFIAGWRDVLPAGTIAGFEAARGPRELLVGPWTHLHPEESSLEPVDHLGEMVRWWDRWLRDEPGDETHTRQPVRFYSQGEERWLESESWPPQGSAESTFWLAAGQRLEPSAPPSGGELRHTVDPTVGTTAGLWDPLGLDMGRPLDQGPDDLRSLTFTGAPLEAPLRIAGAPVATLHASVEEGEELHLVAKLCDVAPDGSSTLITSGWLNARHRVSAAAPEPLVPGVLEEYEVELYPTAYLLEEGHSLRLSVGGADFPRIWPTRTNPTLRLATGPGAESRVTFPVLADEGVSEFQPSRPEAPHEPAGAMIDVEPRWRIERDEISGEATVHSGGRFLFDTPSRSGRVDLDHRGRASVRAAHPEGANTRGETKITADLVSGGTVEVTASTLVTSAGSTAVGRVSIDGTPVFERTWTAERQR